MKARKWLQAICVAAVACCANTTAWAAVTDYLPAVPFQLGNPASIDVTA